MPTALARSLFVLAAALAACTSATPSGGDPTHRRTTTITLADGGQLPARDVTIPAMSSVVFRNGTARSAMVAIEAATCFACETVVGFEPAAGGGRSKTIPPGGVVSICFHEPGAHAFAIAAAGNDQRGTITVGAAR